MEIKVRLSKSKSRRLGATAKAGLEWHFRSPAEGKATPRWHLGLEERLTVRSSRPRFVAPPACLRYASTHSPPLTGRLNSGVRPHEVEFNWRPS